MQQGGEMISFGAGVNSVAMTVMLVNEGWRGPIVFADTGGEWPETYCYMRYFEKEWLKPHGLEITHLSPTTHTDLYDSKRLGGLADTLEDYCLEKGVIPFLAPRWCSEQFKVTPLENWRSRQGLSHSLIAFTIDEGHRKQREGVKYPLLETSITRQECYRIIQRAELEAPHKSSCFFCPGQNLGEWRELYHEHPELYERAIALEDNASKRSGRRITFDSHDISLREHRKRRWQGQLQMNLSEWLPCICKL